MSKIWLSTRRSVLALIGDCRGIAATEFAMIVPIMLVMFFGVVEFSSGVAVDRKVTLIARTVSDLTSQSTTVADTDMTNFFTRQLCDFTAVFFGTSFPAAQSRSLNYTSIPRRWWRRYNGAAGTISQEPAVVALGTGRAAARS